MIKKFLVGDVNEALQDVTKKMDHINYKVDENEKDRIREKILEYKKSLDNGIPMTEHEYEYVLKILNFTAIDKFFLKIRTVPKFGIFPYHKDFRFTEFQAALF